MFHLRVYFLLSVVHIQCPYCIVAIITIFAVTVSFDKSVTCPVIYVGIVFCHGISLNKPDLLQKMRFLLQHSIFYMALCQAAPFLVSSCWVGFASLNNDETLKRDF